MADEIQKLKRDIALNNVIIFVGAGVSFYTTNNENELAHWKGLLKHGLQCCHHLGWISQGIYQDFHDKCNNNNNNTADIDDYLSVANQIKDCLKRKGNMYQKWFRQTIGQLSIKNPDVIQALGELECPIITTNYDSFLEQILNRQILTWNKYCVNDSMNRLQNSILHLYGYYDDIDSIIFSSNDYKRYSKDKYGQTTLKSLIETKTLLFIGYGNQMSDPTLSHLLKYISYIITDKSVSIYKLVTSNKSEQRNELSDTSFLENIKDISYGNNTEDLLSFIENLQSFRPLINESLLFIDRKELIRNKYLNYLVNEYGHVSIFGYSNVNLHLPLESVYVELKFDPTHPSIKAMKTIEIQQEFKRKLLSPGFFTHQELKQLNRALIEKNTFNPESIYKDFMIDQWLNVLLSNTNIFSQIDALTIRNKINRLKRNIMDKNNYKESKQYKIEEAYNEFRHLIILGNPGSGKTTLSKWIIVNMAKQCLGISNSLFNNSSFSSIISKIPILIPIWKYVDHIKQHKTEEKKSLLEFLYENPIFNCSKDFTNEQERKDLSLFIMECLIEGNIFCIFEGLDEVPVSIDRNDLIKEINCLLEHSIDYDNKTNKLYYSIYENKQINTKSPLNGNRFLITSRIEGNYYEDINFFLPRLTIENMSNDALKLFCNSYIQSIQLNLSNGEGGNSSKEYESDQLYLDITNNKDIFQLAINPQLASVIASVYYQYNEKLPENRIDLYETSIQMMIQKLIHNYTNQQFQLNQIIIWSILEQIAEYLHSKIEGLSEDILIHIIKSCLIDYHEQLSVPVIIKVDDIVVELVDIFKYQVGLLNEFGHDSFRFIHRTFQEYLAAKSRIYSYGNLRSEQLIYENILNKIDIPNWRVPLSMTFGILSKLQEHNQLFNNIITRLLTYQQASSNKQFSTVLVPFVLIDSLNDMFFASKDIENGLIRKLGDMLLYDYENIYGFGRLKQHQQLIHSYYMKLKQNYENIIEEWFIEKMNDDDDEDSIAACANIIYQLQWYNEKFHQIFLKNLHNDSSRWNWPIDSILRYYANETKDQEVLSVLTLKNTLNNNDKMVNYITKNNEWSRLIISLYGGYKNQNSPEDIREYYEIVQFLGLSDNQRMPFLFYYQEVWGRNDAAYSMGVRADAIQNEIYWTDVPIFNKNEIYKESLLTSTIINLLTEEKSVMSIMDTLRMEINNQNLSINEKIEVCIALIALGDFDFINLILKQNQNEFIQSFDNRLEQLICTLKHSIARCSSHMPGYLFKIHRCIKSKQLKFNLNFSDYIKIYLSLIADSGGLPVDTKIFVATMNKGEDKYNICAEYLAFKMTGADDGNMQDNVRNVLDETVNLCTSDEIMRSFLKISDSVQMYRPVRAYPWATDIFTFQSICPDDDIPIGFLNCLENLNTNLAFIIQIIFNKFYSEKYFSRNSELIPIFILFTYGVMSKDLNTSAIYDKLLPEVTQQPNIKEFLFVQIQSMPNPYYKSRALYQLAQVYDERSLEFLQESFLLTKYIQKPVLKFQVLEKIFSAVHYKESEQRVFLEEIVNELIVTYDSIEDINDRMIASIRLSFYGSREFRRKYLTDALELLTKMNENDIKIKLIIRLRPVICIYDDLEIKMKEIIENIQNKTFYYFINGFYGRILFNEQISIDTLDFSSASKENSNDNKKKDGAANYKELEALFSLYGQLNDIKLLINKRENLDQLWINLWRDPDNQSNIEKILNIGIKNELFLTAQVAIIVDELIEKGKEDTISILFPNIIKPSTEVLPIVHRWFTDYPNSNIQKLAGLLLTEAKYIYEGSIDTLIEILKGDNDQMRYRAQRLFQHPDRDVNEPNKKTSILGEKVLMKIFYCVLINERFPRVRTYLRTLFFDVLWDDPIVFQNLFKKITELKETNANSERRMLFFNKMKFINNDTWNSVMQSLQSPSYPSHVEAILHSTMRLTQHQQITEDDLGEFAQILSITDINQFKEKLYFSHTDVETVQFILNEFCTLTNIVDETYLEIFELKLINTLTVRVEDLYRQNYDEINQIRLCSFYTSLDLNQTILNMLNNVSVNSILIENLVKWSLQKMTSLRNSDNSLYNLTICNKLLSLISGCVQKEDYLYRKITNSHNFNKHQMIKLLEKILHYHPHFAARGNAFILLSAMDHTDPKVISNAMNALLDENLVKKYSMIGIPLIHLSPNEFLDDLLASLQNESAVRTYEILKILTEFASNETLDGHGKSKIINYIGNEIGELKSKKVVNYYYTDIKIPFTTTLENELYKCWIKIQGLSGKTQYSIDDKKS